MSGQPETILNQVYVQLMVQSMTECCFDVCVAKPGNQLDSKEARCLAMCQDRYQEAFERTFQRQLKKVTDSAEAQMNKQQFNSE